MNDGIAAKCGELAPRRESLFTCRSSKGSLRLPPPPPRKLSSIRFLFLFSRENEWTPVALNDARIGKFHIYNRRRAADERVNFVHPVVSLDMRRLGGLCAL